MAIVETRPDQDEFLEHVAPLHLSGERKTKARVQWALDQFIAAVSKNGEPKQKPQPASAEA